MNPELRDLYSVLHLERDLSRQFQFQDYSTKLENAFDTTLNQNRTNIHGFVPRKKMKSIKVNASITNPTSAIP